jgi:hypothetical protein
MNDGDKRAETSTWELDRIDLLDAIAYGVLYAPDHFPEEDYLAPADQMTADRYYSEMKNRVDKLFLGGFPRREHELSHATLSEAIFHFQSGRANEGAWKLQELEELIRRL